MRTGRKQCAPSMKLASVALLTLAGCRAPGASFGTDPLQHRFCDATRSVIELADVKMPIREHYDRREQQALVEPVVIASNVNQHRAD